MRRTVAAALAAAFLLTVGGCAAGTAPVASTGSPPAGAGPAGLSAARAWVKAAESGMTGAFMELTNRGDADVTVASAGSPAATRVEIHETVQVDGAAVMQPKRGGLTVPAGGTVQLQPGGDHVMLMGLTEPLAPGDEVVLTLHVAGGADLTVTAPVKAFTGADERYHTHAATTAR